MVVQLVVDLVVIGVQQIQQFYKVTLVVRVKQHHHMVPVAEVVRLKRVETLLQAVVQVLAVMVLSW